MNLLELGLSPLDLEARRSGIYGTDAGRIMAGDWKRLWREKKGLAKPEDLSGVLPVQMGSFTEPLNLAWCLLQEGREIEYFTGSDWQALAWKQMTGRTANRQESAIHATIPWMRCNRDALSTTRHGEPCYLDAKHVGRIGDAVLDRYAPQMTHCALVCGVDYWAISFLVGNSRWEYIEAEVDPFYADQLIGKERAFMDLLAADIEPPEHLEPVAPPPPPRLLRTVDLSDNMKAHWPNYAGELIRLMTDFAATKPAADKNAITRKEIGLLLPEDVGTVIRGQMTIKRNRADNLVFHLPKVNTDEPL
jgi:hypothetical protein